MANYRGARYLAASMKAVLAQSELRLELILADDASDDDSVAILPNSLVAKSELVNRTYPSARCTVSVELAHAAGADDRHLRRHHHRVGVAAEQGAEVG